MSGYNITEGFAQDREVGFFGLDSSKLVDTAQTAKQALKTAKLDWKVELEPMYRKNKSGKYDEIEDRFAVVRKDTDVMLGNVGSVFQPLQNVDAFDFMDQLVGKGSAAYHVALEIKGGREVLLVAKMPSFKLLGSDPHDLYTILRNGHTGGRAVQEILTPVRINCTNMMPCAIRAAKHRFAIVHNQSMQAKIAEAAATLNRVQTYVDAFKAFGEAMAKVKLTEAKARVYLDEVLPDRPKIAEFKDNVILTMKESPSIEGHRTDGWGLLNAVTEYMEHGRRDRGREGRLVDVLDGAARRVRTELIEMLEAV